MREVVYALLSSKKFLVAAVAALVWVAGRAGMDISEADLMPVVGALVAYVLAQGWADKGKGAVQEAAKHGVGVEIE